MFRFVQLGQVQKNPDARRHLLFGVGRRLLLIDRTLVNILNLQLFDRKDHLSSNERQDLDIYLNSFYFHFRGLLDNLAWGICYSRSLLGPVSEEDWSDQRRVVLFGKDFMAATKTALPKTAAILVASADWNCELTQLRDPIAHRIPIYSVPSLLDPKDAAEYERLIGEWQAAFKSGNYEAASEHISAAQNVGSYQPLFHADSTGAIYGIWERILFDLQNLDGILTTIAQELEGT